MKKYIYFLVDTFGNGVGDVVRVISEDTDSVYYTDCFGRWCYMEKNNPDIALIKAHSKRQAKKRAKFYFPTVTL